MEVKSADESLQELNIHLTYWQRQLRLDDVDIKLRWMADDEEEDSLGFITLDKIFSHEIVIAIAHPDRFSSKKSKFTHDPEVILVHELLHARDRGWTENEKTETLFQDDVIKNHHEIALDAVAEALVRTRRGVVR